MIKMKLRLVITVSAFALLIVACNDITNTSKENTASTGIAETAEKEAGFESLHTVSQNPTTVALSPQESFLPLLVLPQQRRCRCCHLQL